MRTFFTADTHFDCPKLVENTRPSFGKDHDEELIDNINSTVGRDDRLYILGDFAKKNPYLYRSQIRCRNVLLAYGNHDKPVAKFRSVFGDDVSNRLIKVDGHLIYISHYPHAYWDRSHYGVMHLYGHRHNQSEYKLDKLFPGRRSMDVGIDTALMLFNQYRPFSMSDIVDRLMSRPGHDLIAESERWPSKDYTSEDDNEE